MDIWGRAFLQLEQLGGPEGKGGGIMTEPRAQGGVWAPSTSSGGAPGVSLAAAGEPRGGETELRNFLAGKAWGSQSAGHRTRITPPASRKLSSHLVKRSGGAETKMLTNWTDEETQKRPQSSFTTLSPCQQFPQDRPASFPS